MIACYTVKALGEALDTEVTTLPDGSEALAWTADGAEVTVTQHGPEEAWLVSVASVGEDEPPYREVVRFSRGAHQVTETVAHGLTALREAGRLAG
ncbi:hypothetical protein ACUN7V_15450 [Quadrisphaera oryzae]|uniref:hypothetical protein n=1 Tax=Quadrisphaera TaxID=317661 RepID=UPI00164409A2|nr:hypothetical protein [Quadrisphaera sp. RL12-1S]MBC3760606.1 hypothetical protein [Quadrisphaera sp. RL12-1S]